MCEIVVQLLSHDLLFTTPWTAAHQAFLSFISPRVWSNSCPLSWWCYLSFSSSASPLSPCLQSFPASESFPESWFLASGDQSIGTSALASVPPMNIQGWFPSGLTGLITENCGKFLEKGITDSFACLLRSVYAWQEATLRKRHGTTDWFKIGKEVCQGCVLSLSLCFFNLYEEYIIRNARLDDSQAGIKIAGRNVNNLRYV